MDILSQIQADLLNQNAVLSDVLRKAKVLAYQLESTELKNWVNRELDGYKIRADLPDYRILRAACIGKWTNGYWMVSGKVVPMHLIEDKKIKDMLTAYPVYDGIRYVEQLAQKHEGHFILPPETTSFINHYVQESGYAYAEIEYAIGKHDFEQVLDTVKNRLLDFILELSENWNTNETLPSKDLLNNLVSVHIYNSQSQGGQMSTVFDQRGQQVSNQYNAAGNITINANNKDELISELEKIRSEIERAKTSQGLNQDVAIEVEYHLLQANKEAQKAKPNKGAFLEHVEKAKALLANMVAVAGLVSALSKIVEIAQQLLK
ncbi:MAG: hypothetical protein L6461_08605 [Anaerolineae bacterium]|nr:hypothetical protein [Anaerolineae bacterium]